MPKSTEADRVFDGVVGDILAGVTRPRERISERDLVAKYGVSRTPVREAIKRLFERGFAEPGPKGVAVIVEISNDDLLKLYELRLQLEEKAASDTVANITAEEIEELGRINKRFSSALEKRDLVEMLEVRAEFHALLARATRNPWLQMVLVMLRDKAYVVRHYHWQDLDRATQTMHLHALMIDALRRRATADYREMALRQIRSAIDVYESRLRAKPAATVPAPAPAPAPTLRRNGKGVSASMAK